MILDCREAIKGDQWINLQEQATTYDDVFFGIISLFSRNHLKFLQNVEHQRCSQPSPMLSQVVIALFIENVFVFHILLQLLDVENSIMQQVHFLNIWQSPWEIYNSEK